MLVAGGRLLHGRRVVDEAGRGPEPDRADGGDVRVVRDRRRAAGRRREHDGEIGSAYLVVVGLETVLAIALGVALYDEQLTTVGIAAVVLVMSGTAILAQGSI